jgi:hypothetical protein
LLAIGFDCYIPLTAPIVTLYAPPIGEWYDLAEPGGAEYHFPSFEDAASGIDDVDDDFQSG